MPAKPFRANRNGKRRPHIAGYAIVNDATVLTADRDFDYIARVSELKHEYIARL